MSNEFTSEASSRTSSEVQPGEAEVRELLVRLLDKVQNTSNGMFAETISDALNEWKNPSPRGKVIERQEPPLRESRNAEPNASLLTMTEAAKVMRCSKAHLCNILGGKVRSLPVLPCITLGRRKLIRRTALEKWLENVEQANVQE